MSFSKLIKISITALSIGLTFSSYANQCDVHFLGGVRPIVAPKKMNNVKEFCFSGYGALYSPITKSALYSAEFLTKDRVLNGKGITRVNSFHEEDTLPNGPKLKDYTQKDSTGRKNDRGHLAPNKDMGDAQMAYDSFNLINMVPQDPDNNRNLHEGIEEVTRSMVLRYGSAYVVTSPEYIGAKVDMVGTIMRPTNIWKAVYIPSINVAGAYWENNEPGKFYEILTISELKRRTGTDPFPSLSNDVKNNAVQLPAPTPHGKPL